MNFDFLETEHEKRAFAFSIGVIALTVLAIAAYILTGGSVIFYFFMALELALGFYLVYHMSNEPAVRKPSKARARKAARKR